MIAEAVAPLGCLDTTKVGFLCHQDSGLLITQRGGIMMEKSDVGQPRIIRRRGRGYLAISAVGESLQIGVTADTEEEVVSKFMAVAAQWQALLAGGKESEPSPTAGHTRI